MGDCLKSHLSGSSGLHLTFFLNVAGENMTEKSTASHLNAINIQHIPILSQKYLPQFSCVHEVCAA